VALVSAWLVPVFTLFVSAQFRRFLDANVLNLARFLSGISIALLVLVLFELAQIIIFTILHKKPVYLTALGIVIPVAAFGVLVLAVTISIEYVSGGL
jgi:hypothetical protein